MTDTWTNCEDRRPNTSDYYWFRHIDKPSEWKIGFYDSDFFSGIDFESHWSGGWLGCYEWKEI